MIQEVIVVEGRDDTRRLQEVFGQIDTIETQGSAINQEILERIKKAHDKRGVIVFTDPDYPGQRIRAIIQEAIPTVKHAFLSQEEAVSKRANESLGIEHASASAIKKALEQVHTIQIERNSMITQATLIRLGLIGRVDSAMRRDVVTRELAIGYANGKQLLKRLTMFGITQEELEQAVWNYEKENT